MRLVEGATQVVVVRDEVHLGAPRPVVEVLEVGGHEVRRDRYAGGDPVQHVPLGAVAVQQLVGGEPAEVQQLCRVRERGGRAGRGDLVPVVVVLAPEGGAPGFVEGVDVAVPPLQPATERHSARVAVAERVVAAVLVVHVPHGQRRVGAVVRGQCLGQRHRGVAVGGRARAERLAPARPQRRADPVDRQALGVQLGEPRGRRGARRREVDRDAPAVQQVDDPVQPAEVEPVGGRMQQRPGPNRAGPFGLLQTLADGMKLALKEDVTPKNADKVVFLLAPIIAGAMAFVSFSIIPMGPMVSMRSARY